MILRKLAPLLTLSLLVALAGCAPDPTVPPVSEPKPSLNEVHKISDIKVEELIEQFPDGTIEIPGAGNVYACVDQEAGIGHWIDALAFSTTDIPSGVVAVREAFADIETSYGTAQQDIEYSDGSTWPVPAHHVLFEDETGSYLLTHNGSEAGLVEIRVITSCGELK